jgi:WD40 repeat protein
MHPSPTPTKTAIDPVQLNGQITSAEQYLGSEASGYDWRSFDAVSETGLLVIRKSGEELEGLGIVGRTGPVATLTCAGDLRCPPKDSHVYVATLGPGADEVTVESGDGTAQVIGYDGTLRRTLDLGATTSGGAEVRGLRWSTDGSRLAVVTNRYLEPECDRVSQLWLVDQGGEAQLAYSLLLDCAALNNEPPNRDASGFDGEGEIFTASGWGWSPDGQTVLLDVYRGTQSSDVVLLHLQPDGAADPVVDQDLYHSNRHFDWAGNVAWSPDGTRIAVRTARQASRNTGPVVEISASDGRELAEHPDDGGWLIWPAREG